MFASLKWRKFSCLVVLGYVLSSATLRAEEESPTPLLIPKKTKAPVEEIKKAAAVPVKLRPRPFAHRSKRPQSSVLLITPLWKENTYDARFLTYGLSFRISGMVWDLQDLGSLQIESGLGLTFSMLSISQPATDFWHIFLHIPVIARMRVPVSSFADFEVFAGGVWRPLAYDSRSTTDGGLHVQTPLTDFIDPEFGIGASFALGRSMDLRVSASYLYLGAGIQFHF